MDPRSKRAAAINVVFQRIIYYPLFTDSIEACACLNRDIGTRSLDLLIQFCSVAHHKSTITCCHQALSSGNRMENVVP